MLFFQNLKSYPAIMEKAKGPAGGGGEGRVEVVKRLMTHFVRINGIICTKAR